MDFHQLLAKMQELDQPQVEAAPVVDQPVTECPPEGPMGMDHSTPETSPPSMSVNLNAQGLDNISDILKLIAKVNPDAEKPADASLPSMGAMPSLTPPGPKIGGLGNLDAGPLKMLPDLDSDEGPSDEPKTIDVSFGDEGPEDEMDDEPEQDDEEEKEAFGNSLGDSEPEERGSPFDAEGDDLHKPKKSFSDKPYRGDNPMAAESTDLRSQIRAELLRRLNEAKGVK